MAARAARTERAAAVLVRSVNFGEADRIVTLLTESRGKVSLMARGARRSKKRFGAALEPYALIEAEFSLGRSDVGRLASARVVRAFPGLLRSLEKIGVAASALELARETTAAHEAPDPRLLPTIVRLLELLEAVTPEAVSALHLAFVLRLLTISGHAPNLERCGRCGKAAPEQRAALFDPRLGSIVCRACGGAPIKLAGAARAAMIAAGTRAWDEPDPRLDGLAAQAVQTFVNWQLGRRLAAQDVLVQLHGVQGPEIAPEPPVSKEEDRSDE